MSTIEARRCRTAIARVSILRSLARVSAARTRRTARGRALNKNDVVRSRNEPRTQATTTRGLKLRRRLERLEGGVHRAGDPHSGRQPVTRERTQETTTSSPDRRSRKGAAAAAEAVFMLGRRHDTTVRGYQRADVTRHRRRRLRGAARPRAFSRSDNCRRVADGDCERENQRSLFQRHLQSHTTRPATALPGTRLASEAATLASEWLLRATPPRRLADGVPLSLTRGSMFHCAVLV
jgi:hypothetical protein